MPLPEVTLTELIATVHKIASPESNTQDAVPMVLNKAQTEATEFIFRIANSVNLVSSTYSSIDSKFKNKDSKPFLQQVIAGALLFQLINITTTHSIESVVQSECHIGKQILDFFAAKTLSDIPPEDATNLLRCLGQFIQVLNRTPNSPIWIKDVPTSILLDLISGQIKNHPTWVATNQPKHQEWVAKQQQEARELQALNEHVTAVMATIDTVNAKVQEQKAQDQNRYFGSYLPSRVDPLIENSINFIQNITKYSATPEAKTTLSAAQFSHAKPIHLSSFLQNVSKGAMLLELIAIAAASPNPEEQSKHALGKVILEFFQVKQLADIPESTVVECLNCLDQFIHANPETMRWNQVKTNDALRQIISTELKKRPGWELVEVECKTNPMMAIM